MYKTYEPGPAFPTRLHVRPADSDQTDQSSQGALCVAKDSKRLQMESNITKTRLFKYIEHFDCKKNPENFQIKTLYFYISAQNIDCGYSLEPPRRGGSNEHLQTMFLSRNKKNNVYPCKPQLYYIKVGFKGVKII